MSTYLAHHGILGMRWGVRRWQNKDGTRTARGKARYSKSNPKRRAAKSNETLQKKVKGMTNEELNAAINRMRMEQNYMQMISSNQTKAGEAKLKRYMSEFGNTLAEDLIRDSAKALSKRIVDGILAVFDNRN